jgi:hypothetical protein
LNDLTPAALLKTWTQDGVVDDELALAPDFEVDVPCMMDQIGRTASRKLCVFDVVVDVAPEGEEIKTRGPKNTILYSLGVSAKGPINNCIIAITGRSLLQVKRSILTCCTTAV